MKITEIVNGIYTYSATVRVKRGKSQTTARTIVFADGVSQARAMLAAMYGDDAVVSVTRIYESHLTETIPNRKKPAIQQLPKVLPTAHIRKLVQNALLNQMKRNALQVKPTIDDLRAAKEEFDTEQKRANLDYEEAVKKNERSDEASERHY